MILAVGRPARRIAGPLHRRRGLRGLRRGRGSPRALTALDRAALSAAAHGRVMIYIRACSWLEIKALDCESGGVAMADLASAQAARACMSAESSQYNTRTILHCFSNLRTMTQPARRSRGAAAARRSRHLSVSRRRGAAGVMLRAASCTVQAAGTWPTLRSALAASRIQSSHTIQSSRPCGTHALGRRRTQRTALPDPPGTPHTRSERHIVRWAAGRAACRSHNSWLLIGGQSRSIVYTKDTAAPNCRAQRIAA